MAYQPLSSLTQKPPTPSFSVPNSTAPSLGQGASFSVAPSKTQTTTPNFIPANSMGVQTKSPQQNVSQPSNSLKPSQVSTQPKYTSSGVNAGIDPYTVGQNLNTNTSTQVAGSTTSAPSASSITQPTDQPATQAPSVSNGGLFGQATQGLVNYGTGNESPQVTQARQALQNLQDSYAQKIANIDMYAGDTINEQGQAGIAQRLYATQLDAAQNALNSALTSQGQQIGSLNNAGGLLSPSNVNAQVPYSNQYINGFTGSAVNGQSAEQNAQSGGNAYGTYQAAVSNAQNKGTAVTSANSSGLQDSIQQETALNTAAANATGLAKQVQSALSNSGLQLGNSQDANAVISNLQSRLGNTAYTQLVTAVNDARTAYQQILQSTGATPTDAGNQAQQNININMSPNQIISALNQLNQGVAIKQASAHQQTLNYQNQLNSSGSSGSGSTNSAWPGWNP